MAQMIHVLLWGMFLKNWSSSEPSNNPEYDFHEGPKSWIDALKHCQENHHRLVVMNTTGKTESVKGVLKRKDADMITDGVWIGLERSIFGCNVPWLWISGVNFRGNMDNVDSTHYCGKTKLEENEVKIMSGNCFKKLPFICECKD